MTRRILLAAAACAAAGLLLVLLRWDEPGATAFCSALTVAALATAVLADRRSAAGARTRLSWAVVVLLLAAGTAWAALGTGAPGAGPALLLVGSAVGAGALVVRAARSGAATPVRGAGVLTVAAAALVTAALGAAAVPVLDRAAVTSQTSQGLSSEPGPAAVPDPLAVRWRWNAGAPVRDVRATGSGVAVLRDDDVVGLDGPTGTPRWSHRRAGASPTSVDVSPDGSTVVVASAVEPLRDGRDLLLTALDATTGEMLWTEIVAAEPLVVDDHVVVVPESAGATSETVAARELRSGSRTWWRTAEPRCSFLAGGRGSAIVLLEECPGPVGGPRSTVTLRAFDPARGGELWRSASVPGGSRTAGVETSADGRYVLALDGAVLDAARGTVVLPPEPGSSVEEVDGTLVSVRDEGGLAGVVEDGGMRRTSSACPPGTGPFALATVPSGVAELCRDGGGGLEVRTGPDAPPVPVGPTDAPEDDPSASSASVDGPWLVAAPGVVAVCDPGPDGTGWTVVGLG